ncbi:MAG TPA: protein kinase [Vicinamibacteria bacterium]
MKYCDNCHSAYPDDFTICPRDQGSLRYASELVPGVVIRGKYEILEKIGTGGMATVYRARHLAFGEIVAIKLVGPKLAHDPDFLKRFRTEAVVTRKLQHPNAVRVEDLDTTEDGRPFIVMEYVNGRSLREVIRTEGALSLPRAVAIARQACSALAAAHALGITHRDIKPDNILLAPSPGGDVVKILDFGIAKVKEGSFDTGEGYTPTQTGMVMGTPQYISPEQAMGKRGAEVDGRSDLYSLGVVLYEMVTGRLPFSSDTAMGMILHHLQTAPTPPQIARADLSIPGPLSDLLMKALQKERDRRFASADEMLAALDAVAALPMPSAPLPSRGAAASRQSPVPLPTPTPADKPTPRPALTTIEDIEDRPTRALPRRSEAPVTPVPPLPRSFPPLPRGEPTPIPTPIPSTTVPEAAWLLFLLLPLRFALLPLKLFRRIARRSSPPGPPVTVMTARHRGFPRFLFRQWWFWVAFGLFMMIFNRARHEDRRGSHDSDTNTAVEAPAVSQPAAPDDASAGPSHPKATVPDEQLQASVEKVLSTSKLTKGEEIEVNADSGTVTLSGEVSTPLVSHVAQALAETVAGVDKVNNRLKTVEGHAGPPPGWPDLSGIPFLHPPAPGSPEAKALAELLDQGQQALKNDQPEEALGMFGAALSLDPKNRTARRGLEQATRNMKRRHPEVPAAPTAPTPP